MLQTVAMVTWLAEGEAAHLVSSSERADPLLLLFLCAKLQDGPDVQRLRITEQSQH